VTGGAPAPPATTPPGVPPWFRAMVWDSLLGGLCPLLPVPFVDDIALAGVRRRMVERLVARWAVTLTPAQLKLLAGGGRGSLLRFALKVLVYPFKELFRKILYFLAVKDAVDTFSLLFHQGYLVQRALGGGALGGGGAVDDARVAWVAAGVHGALAATDTRPLRRLLAGVLRNSQRLFVATLRWIANTLRGPATVADVAEQGASRQALASPEAEQLLDRLLLVLWNERAYLDRLDAELDRRLGAA
jgi:hypothetical protein